MLVAVHTLICGVLHDPASVTNAGLASRRLIMMTDAFVAAQPRLAETILERMGGFAKCKWTVTQHIDWFTTRSKAEPAIAVAFRAAGEIANAVLPDVRQAFTSAEALDFFYRVDDTSTTVGACGR